MDNMTTLIIQLLSAGVITSLVAGVFSLIIAVKNNGYLMEIEKNKQIFTAKQKRRKELKRAYNKLVKELPEKNRILTRLCYQKNDCETDSPTISEIIKTNLEIIRSHFQDYCYLFTNDERDVINKLIQSIDAIMTGVIIDTSSGGQVYSSEIEEDEDQIIGERIKRVNDLENEYYNLYCNNLANF